MRLLLIEDDAVLRLGLKRQLEADGYRVDQAADGADGLFQAREYPLDLAIVDLGLPKVNGLTVVQTLRVEGCTLPILILTARGSWQDKVQGLEAGADDYLVKPFGAGELMARVRAQLRRHTQQAGESTIRFGDVCIDLAHRLVERAGQLLHLTPIEYRLLTYLVAQANRVVTHRQLLTVVWGPGHSEDSHYVRVHMANLRKKIEDDASMPRYIITEAGIGYRFVPGT